jgi:glycosyltransferase involved in cell wall biosynthesis
MKTYSTLYRRFCKKIKNQKFDIVHFCSSASISLIKDIILLRAAKQKKIKTIIHFHFGRIPELYKKRNWEQKLLHIVIKLADKAIVIDKKSYDTLLSEGYTNIELLPNPLSPTVNDMIANYSDVVRDDRKIVFAGHLVPTKGVYELIGACKYMRNIKLKMLGFVSEDMKSKLFELAGDNNDWLEIAGEQTLDNVIKEMLTASVFVLPTYTEGFPNVILESMACGCPIVASAVGAIPEMLDINGNNNCGICIEPKNTEQLQKSINKLLEDRIFAKECGTNAKKRVNELYSMPEVWNKMETIWKSS